MIRVYQTLERQTRVLRIDGDLTAEDVPALETFWGEVGRPHVLDLAGLQSADTIRSEILRELASSGVETRGASPYVRLLLSLDDNE